MRLGDDLLHRISGRAGRVTCKRCGYKIGIDARGSSLEVLSGGHKLNLGASDLALDADAEEQSDELLEAAPLSGDEAPISTEDVLREMTTHFSEYPLSLRDGADPTPPARVSLAPPISDELKARRRASQIAQPVSDTQFTEAPLPPLYRDDDSLSPHALGELEDDEDGFHLPENFKSSPMSSNLRDETFQSLYPQPREPTPQGVESRFERENRARAKHPPVAGQLKRPVAAANVSQPPEELSAPSKSSSWGPWALAIAACIGLVINMATGPLDAGISSLFGKKTQGKTPPQLQDSDATQAAVAVKEPQMEAATNWVELLPEDQVAEESPVLEQPVQESAAFAKKQITAGETSEQTKAKAEKEAVVEELMIPFSTSAAAQAIQQASVLASRCRRAGDPSGVATINITFSSSGSVTTATVSGPPFAGTETGSCIADQFRKAKVPEFSGERVTMSKTVTIN